MRPLSGSKRRKLSASHNKSRMNSTPATREVAQAVVGKTPPGGAASTTDKSIQKAPTKTTTEKPPSTATGDPLKRPVQPEHPKPQKKAKASKADNEVTTLTEGELNEIESTVRDTTLDAVDEAMSE